MIHEYMKDIIKTISDSTKKTKIKVIFSYFFNILLSITLSHEYLY